MKIDKNKDITSQAFDSVCKYDELLLNRLLDAGADVKKLDSFGHNILFKCLDYQEFSNFSIKFYRKLLKLGSDVNICTSRGNTPLLISCADPFDIKITKLLLDFGANPDNQGLVKKTALMRLVENNKIDGVELLLKYGADPYIINSYEQNFVDIANDKSTEHFLINDPKIQIQIIRKFPHTFNAFKKYLSAEILNKFSHLTKASELNLL